MLNRPILYYVVDLMKLRVPRWLIAQHLGITESEAARYIEQAHSLWRTLPRAVRPSMLDPEVRAIVTQPRATHPEPLDAALERAAHPVRVSPGTRLSDASWAVLEVLGRAVMPLSALTLARRLGMPVEDVRDHIIALRRSGRVVADRNGPNGRTYRVPDGVPYVRD
jgi:biotin operon repressor